MHAIYDLKEQLCKELEEYGEKGELTAGTLDVVDKLAHTIKNIDKIIEKYEEEEGYSEGSYNNGSYNDGSYGRGNRTYNIRGSYARGRNAKRDSMGRYSRNGSYDNGMVQELRDLMNEAPDERTRREFQSFISKMEQM